MILHIIVFGTLLFQFVIFAVQYVLFKRKEFLYFSVFCLSTALHYYLYNEAIFEINSFFHDRMRLNFFLRRQLGLLSFLTYIQFSRYFLDLKVHFPHIDPQVRLLEKAIMANMIIQAIAALVFTDDRILDLIFVSCFLVVAICTAFIVRHIVRKGNMESRFISIGSLAIILGTVLLMFAQSFNIDYFDPQVFLDIGLIVNVLFPQYRYGV